MAGADQADPSRREAWPVRMLPLPALILLAAVVGCVGGIYGIGGGPILAPILIGTGRRRGKLLPLR